ncbi:MAG: CoA-transferase [Pseudomonadota bacterium]|nr:CoA-transferase [Pseudomonadota bacterium]
MAQFLKDAGEIAAAIPDGALLALPPEYAPCSMTTIRALVRRRARYLRLLGVPQFGLQADMLIGAGCVAEVETAAVTFGELGLAPRFTDAVKRGTIRMKDTTCPAIHAALQASEKGVPFMPLRGLIGTEVAARRPDWKLGTNPFAEDDPIIYLPAIRPDVTLFHAPKADRQGNVWIGVRRELVVMAHASRTTYATVEEIIDGSLLHDPLTAAGTIPALYVTAIAEARQGCWPLALPHGYAADHEHLALYARMAQTQEGFDSYLNQFVLGREAAE